MYVGVPLVFMPVRLCICLKFILPRDSSSFVHWALNNISYYFCAFLSLNKKKDLKKVKKKKKKNPHQGQ